MKNATLGYSGLLRYIIDIKNLGLSSLSTSAAAITGTGADGFGITDTTSVGIATNGNLPSVLTFEPPHWGAYQATVTITTNDPLKSSYAYTVYGTGISPEIGLTNAIGAATPTTLSNGGSIDFGDVVKDGSSSTQTIKISNTGNTDLSITSVTKNGDAGGDFLTTDMPGGSITVPAGSSASFSISFHPLSDGPKSATFTVINDDPDTTKQSYVFTVKGNDPSAVLAIKEVAGGVESDVPSAGIDFGKREKNTSSGTRTFRLYNNGNESWTLASASNSGGASGDFINTAPASSISASAYSEFTLYFHPADVGARGTTLQIIGRDSGGTVQRRLDLPLAGTGVLVPTGSLGAPSATPPKSLALKGSTYFGESPLRVTLSTTGVANATDYLWDLNGDGTFETSTLVTAPMPYIDIASPKLLTVKMMAHNSTYDTRGPESSVAIGAYPGEKMSLPMVSGVPFDPEPPYIDGILEGNDSKPDPIGTTSAVFGENGWKGAYLIPFGDDGTTEFAMVNLIREENYLYFGIKFNYDSALTEDDKIYIGIGKNAAARTNDADSVGLITLTPSSNTITMKYLSTSGWQSLASLPANVSFKAKSASAHSWGAELKLPINSALGTTPPDSQKWLQVAGQFLLFLKIEPCETSPSTYTPFTWPRTVPTAVANPESEAAWWGLAARDNSIATNGLYFLNSNSIGVRDPARPNPTDPLLSTIRFTNPTVSATNSVINILVARVLNNACTYTLDASGVPKPQPLAANDIRVRFKIANWGITPTDPKYWADVVVPPIALDSNSVNPTSPVATVPAATVSGTTIAPSMKEFEVHWKLFDHDGDLVYPNQIKQYNSDAVAYAGFPGLKIRHQCFLAQIESTAANYGASADPSQAVNIVTKSVYRNMDFSPSNPGKEGFSSDAQINLMGLDALGTATGKAFLKGDPTRKVLVRLYTRSWTTSKNTLEAFDRDTTRLLEASRRAGGKPLAAAKLASERPYTEELRPYISEAKGTVSCLEYIVKAYSYTGRFKMRGGTRIDEVLPIGSYGYEVRHAGIAFGWKYGIVGKNVSVQKINDTTYILTYPATGVGTFTDTIKAKGFLE